MKRRTIPTGITLVELLVAITVMVVLLALLVPRLRIVSDDNRVSEAARLVSSQISLASSASLANRRQLHAPEEYQLNSPISSRAVFFHFNHNMTQDEVVFGTTAIQQARVKILESP